MQKETFPAKLDPFRFADNQVCLESVIPLHQLTRLSPSLCAHEGNVELTLNFGVDEEGLRFVRGQVEAKVALQCQRCMEPFLYPIKSSFASGIVATEEAADRLPSRYEALLIKGKTENAALLIRDIIEDEL